MKLSIEKWNFWWYNSKKLIEFNWVERDVLKYVIKLINYPHIKDIIGVRRSGKTVLMYQTIRYLIKQGVDPKEILYLNFDDPEFNDIKKTISAALEINPNIKYLFLDEVQNIQNWERVIRVYYDRQEFKQIFVSGSTASLISRDIGKTLTGRHMTIFVFPFSFKEFLAKINFKYNPCKTEKVIYYLEKYLREGGFPETLCNKIISKEPILINIYNDVLVRDVVSRFKVDFEILKHLSYYLMSNIGKPFSENSVAKALNLHPETVKKYLSFLKEVFVFYYVNQFSWKIKNQLKKDMKCYAIDTGLRNAVSFTISSDIGRLAENVVLLELKRRNKEVYFWKEKKEVDFVIRDKDIIGINVSYTDDIPEREYEALFEFKKKFPKAKLLIITKNVEGKEKGIKLVPLWKWLLHKDE